jgi:hypothetical protein
MIHRGDAEDAEKSKPTSVCNQRNLQAPRPRNFFAQAHAISFFSAISASPR